MGNMKKYVENVKEYVGNMKNMWKILRNIWEYEKICGKSEEMYKKYAENL